MLTPNTISNGSIAPTFTVFHGSPADPMLYTDGFLPFSHFGTRQSAIERLQNLKRRGLLESKGAAYIASVSLSLINPLQVHDYGAVDLTGVYNALETALGFGEAEYRSSMNIRMNFLKLDKSRRRGTHSPEYDALANLLREYIVKNGNDGLIYTNSVEDKGNPSWVNLTPAQVTILKVDRVSI